MFVWIIYFPTSCGWCKKKKLKSKLIKQKIGFFKIDYWMEMPNFDHEFDFLDIR